MLEKAYKIKPLEWENLGPHTRFIRYRSNTSAYYRYEIYKYVLLSGEWSKFKLEIKLNDKVFYTKPTGPISSCEYEDLEEAFDVANRHHSNFVKQFLTEV